MAVQLDWLLFVEGINMLEKLVISRKHLVNTKRSDGTPECTVIFLPTKCSYEEMKQLIRLMKKTSEVQENILLATGNLKMLFSFAGCTWYD